MSSVKHKTTCCYCGVGCGIQVQKHQDGHITLEGDIEHPANKGMLCSKGNTLHHTVNNKTDRLMYPQMRWHKDMPRQRVSWDQALDRTAAVFTSIIKKYGPDSVAFYASGQCLTEEYYVLNKLVKGFIGTNNIDTNSRLCMSSAVVGYKKSLGEDSVPISYDDIELCDVLFVTGANPAWCHPIIWRRVEQAKLANPDLKIIVSDPRKTASCDIADIHLQINPGTDIVLHHAIARLLIESGNIDMDFIRNHTEGFENFKTNIFSKSINDSAIECGIMVSDIQTVANLIGHSKKGFLSMWTMGLNQSVIGVNKNLSLINLHLITGHIGKPGAGPFSLTGQPNAMGGREVGGLSNLLPAHRDLSKENDRNDVERFWQIPLGTIASKPGLTATEIFDALDTEKVKAIWILCTNPLISLPDVRKAERALAKARFVVIQDVHSSVETLQYADVVLPAAAWTEKEGTMTSAGRYITHLEKIVDAPGEALPDAEIMCRFAQKMKFEGFYFQRTEDIFIEYAQITSGTNIDISGLDYTILRNKRAVQWPFPKEFIGKEGAGTKRLFQDKKFYTPGQKAIIHTVPDENKSERITPEYPLILTTGRIRDQWHTRSKTGKVNKLNQHIPYNYVEMHPADAAQRQIVHNDLVEISNNRGNMRLRVKISTDIKPGVVFVPMHWGKIKNNDLHRVNNLTNNLIDPSSKEPDFKYATVEVQKYIKPKQNIIVIGAGAGAHGFVKSYRLVNNTDDITIFSKEPLPFYNRVLLPDYVSGHLTWDQLVKMSEEDEKFYSIQFKRGLRIDKLDTTKKQVTDALGDIHHYDVLILATGSNAALPKDTPMMNGILTMRSKYDADRLINNIHPSSSILIIGGGLLGIEMAAALIEMGHKVTIIQRISRLMDRQLDHVGSDILHNLLTMRGITIYYNDEVEQYIGSEYVQGIKLKSGITLECNAVVIAIGTSPSIDILKPTDIKTNKGVLVDDFMLTSIPNVYAIGEIAEWNGKLFGITAAAEEQAQIVSDHISGDIAHTYKGSLLMNILKIQGADICSLGEIEVPHDVSGYEEIIFLDKAKHYYKKCLVYQDRLVGAILIGDKVEFLEYRKLIADKIELGEKRLQLLRSGKLPEPVIGKLVCSCNQVGDGNIAAKINEGCNDLLQLCQLTGAGMGCGSCRSEVNKILKEQILQPLLPIV